jgi:hypothetical protein
MIFEGRFCQFVKHLKEKEALNLILVFDFFKKKDSKNHWWFRERIGKYPAVLSGYLKKNSFIWQPWLYAIAR